jgi:hypothetical protein
MRVVVQCANTEQAVAPGLACDLRTFGGHIQSSQFLRSRVRNRPARRVMWRGPPIWRLRTKLVLFSLPRKIGNLLALQSSGQIEVLILKNPAGGCWIHDAVTKTYSAPAGNLTGGNLKSADDWASVLLRFLSPGTIAELILWASIPKPCGAIALAPSYTRACRSRGGFGSHRSRSANASPGKAPAPGASIGFRRFAGSDRNSAAPDRRC